MLDLRVGWSGNPQKIEGCRLCERTQPILKAESSFIGIDYHKRYSVFCVLEAQGMILERGRIDHLCPEQFVSLVRRCARVSGSL